MKRTLGCLLKMVGMVHKTKPKSGCCLVDQEHHQVPKTKPTSGCCLVDREHHQTLADAKDLRTLGHV